MIVCKDNVQYIIDEKDFPKYEAQGFMQFNDVSKKEPKEKKKSLSKMNNEELKTIAMELGIENCDSLTNKELIAVIKEKQNGQHE